MRKGRKPFNNKQDFDPGRLRNHIEFISMEWVDDGQGGGSNQEVTVYETRGAKETISLNSLSQLATIAESTVFGQSFFVTIRNNPNWMPEKDMLMKIDNEPFVMQGFVPTDNPQTFIKLLCSRRV